MIFNAHCHVFNVHTVGTSKARRVISQRAARTLFPGHERIVAPIVERALKALQSGVELPGVIADLPQALLSAVCAGVASVPCLDADVTFVDLEGQPYHAGIQGLLRFLQVMAKRSVAEVADTLFSLTSMALEVPEKDLAIAPMMMDIGKDCDEPCRWSQQVEETFELASKHKSRVFPFYAMNLEKPGTLDARLGTLKDWQRELVCGVKLYPALERKWPPDAFDELARACVRNRLPIMTHCMMDGFVEDLDGGRHGFPGGWEDVLHKVSGLRVCFGHFGGDNEWAVDRFASAGGSCASCWPQKIIGLMREHEGVYADLSFHVKPLDWQHRLMMHADRRTGSDAATKLQIYLENLRWVLEQPQVRDRVLWGTDFPLNQLLVHERAYINFFRSELGSENFDRIAQRNPARFLSREGP